MGTGAIEPMQEATNEMEAIMGTHAGSHNGEAQWGTCRKYTNRGRLPPIGNLLHAGSHQ
jgi:hypothetical protein